MNKSIKIGVIAEEKNDIETLDVITSKIVPSSEYKFVPFVAHGCGKLRRKCSSWAENLLDRGCTHLIVLHDCDRNNPAALLSDIEAMVVSHSYRARIVLIPTEEIEAWLLSDPVAIQQTFNLQKPPKIPRNTEAIPSPKEFLINLISKASRATYINTVHNPRIARNVTISSLEKCKSFLPYPEFLKSHILKSRSSNRKTAGATETRKRKLGCATSKKRG